MNKKIFLALILIFTLLFSTFSIITEGACNYEDGGSISSGSGSGSSLAGKNEAPIVGRTKNSCQTAGIYKNSNSLKNVTKKLGELTKLATNVENSVLGNTKNVGKNAKKAKKIKCTINEDCEGDEGDDAMCEDYPDACKETKLPKKISKSQFNREMSGR